MEKKDKPLFMMDDSETDGPAEIVMDYVLSWCLRLADDTYKESDTLLHKFCRYMMGKILKIEDITNVVFYNVKVWKEEKSIDLWVELNVFQNGNVSQYAISIENKYYSPIKTWKGTDGKIHSQLEKYKKTFSDYYKKEEENGREWNPRYALITCIGRDDEKFKSYYEEDCKKNEYSLFSILDLLDPKLNKQETKSDIFNEFWLKDW